MTIVFLFILGTAIGSFLNVLIDRLPRDESVLEGRSYCETCKKELLWNDLIPILSFLMLQGKCRYCKTTLSFYYPLVEFITGFMFVATYVSSGEKNLLSTIYYLLLQSGFIAIFFTDLKYGIIPDKIVYSLIFVSLLFLTVQSKAVLLPHLVSAAGALLFFLLLFFVTHGKGMGLGDVKLAFLLGLSLGFPNVVVALYVAFLTGAFISLFLMLFRKYSIKQTIPFGPFLVFGTFLSLFYGNKLLAFMLTFLKISI